MRTLSKEVNMSGIRWDEDEKNILAECVAKDRLTNVDATLTQLLNDAQRVLPEGRRRGKISSHKMVKGFDRLVKEHIIRLTHIKRMETPHSELEPEDVLGMLSVGDLVDVLLDRLVEKLQGVSVSKISEVVTQTREQYHIETGTESQKKKGPTVGIVGMYLPNFRALENRVKNENVRLRYLDSEKPPTQIPSVEYMICVPNRLPHTWQDFAKSRYKDRAYIVRGRVREAERVVRDIINTGKSTLHY